MNPLNAVVDLLYVSKGILYMLVCREENTYILKYLYFKKY